MKTKKFCFWIFFLILSHTILSQSQLSEANGWVGGKWEIYPPTVIDSVKSEFLTGQYSSVCQKFTIFGTSSIQQEGANSSLAAFLKKGFSTRDVPDSIFLDYRFPIEEEVNVEEIYMFNMRFFGKGEEATLGIPTVPVPQRDEWKRVRFSTARISKIAWDSLQFVIAVRCKQGLTRTVFSVLLDNLRFRKGNQIELIDGFGDTITSVPCETQLPQNFSLSQNYPNPFNPTTVIRYQVSGMSHVTLGVYDVLGQEVAMLVNEEKFPGSYEVNFNASNLSSGVYFYTLRAGNFVETKKMLLIK